MQMQIQRTLQIKLGDRIYRNQDHAYALGTIQNDYDMFQFSITKLEPSEINQYKRRSKELNQINHITEIKTPFPALYSLLDLMKDAFVERNELIENINNQDRETIENLCNYMQRNRKGDEFINFYVQGDCSEKDITVSFYGGLSLNEYIQDVKCGIK